VRDQITLDVQKRPDFDFDVGEEGEEIGVVEQLRLEVRLDTLNAPLLGSGQSAPPLGVVVAFPCSRAQLV
jgi:hypothetical protein